MLASKMKRQILLQVSIVIFNNLGSSAKYGYDGWGWGGYGNYTYKYGGHSFEPGDGYVGQLTGNIGEETETERNMGEESSMINIDYRLKCKVLSL